MVVCLHYEVIQRVTAVFFFMYCRGAATMPKAAPPGRRSQRARSNAATGDPPRVRQGATRTRAASSTDNGASGSSDTRPLQNVQPTPGEVDGSAGLITIDKQQLEDMIGGMVQAAVAAAATVAVPGPSTAEQQSTLVSPDVQQTSPTVQTVAAPEALDESSMTAPATLNPDLHINVAASLRQNIISHRFVNLGVLLDGTDRDNTQPEGSFMLVDGRLRPARPPRTIGTFAAWSTAFLRYAGIYLQAHPTDALGLINHMRQVSALTAPGLGLAWKEFDEQYRRAREISPDMHRWGEAEANSPMWLNSIARGIAGASAGQARGTPGATRFRPICLSFNRIGGCTRGRCNYLHVCRVCRQAHSALRCPQSGPRGPGLRYQRPPTKPAALPAPRK